jgi:hypothetical protein
MFHMIADFGYPFRGHDPSQGRPALPLRTKIRQKGMPRNVGPNNNVEIFAQVCFSSLG